MTMELRDFIPAVKYGASFANSYLPSGRILLGDSSDYAKEVILGRDLTIDSDGSVTLTNLPFITITAFGTTALTNGGTISIMPNSSVTGSRRVYITDWHFTIGAESWRGGSSAMTLSIKDTTGTTYFSWGTSSMVGAATTGIFGTYGTGSTVGLGITYGNPWTYGATAIGKGLMLGSNAGAWCLDGADGTLVISGIIK